MDSHAIPVYVLILVLIENISRSEPFLEKHTAKDYYCSEQIDHGRKSLNCSNQNLTYIPKTKNYIKSLIFNYNDLTNVTSETFENISNPDNLIELELDHNDIQNISSSALNIFPNLKFLYFSFNPVDYENLKNLLGVLSSFKFLSHLAIGGIRTVTIQKDLFSLMRENWIETLEVTFYNMKTVSMDIFRNFNKLKTLILRENQIKDMKLSQYLYLHSLYIDQNDIKEFPSFSIDGNESNCYLPNIEYINAQNNDIQEMRSDNLKCLVKLKKLKLGGNPITVLHNNFLTNLPNIDLLQLRLSTRRITVQPFAFNSTSLAEIHLACIGRATDVFVSLNDTFKFTPNLKSLSLSQIRMLLFTEKQMFELFSPLVNVNYFQCFGCKFSKDPKFVLNHMKHLLHVGLQSNFITALSGETFKENRHLKHLSLRYNQIEHIYESALPESLLNGLHYLDLSKNPFACDCDLEWFISWMKASKTKNVISRYPQEYICSFPKEKSKLRLSDLSFTCRECHPWSPWIWFAIIASPCTIVIGIAVLLLYRNRWSIKHYIYLLRKRRNYKVIDGQNFVYDAFIGYEADDSAWVRRRLLPVLEDEVGLKLCIHERDFQPGHFINDNIVTNMDKSEKIVLVLTNAFTRSGWCMFELKTAHSKLIEDKTELVVILLEKIDGKNMNHSLKVLFDTTTYIEWTEDVVGQKLFWTKLKTIMNK